MEHAAVPDTADRRRWIALVVVCCAMLMNALDASIVNVALPSIQRDLHFSQSNLTWVVDAYLISFGSFLLLAGRLGDLVGRRKVFLAGVALFTVASALCAAAPDQGVLIAMRFLQGLGGAVSSSVIIAIIVTEFPIPAERARAMSSYMLVTVAGGSLGLLAGGVLTEAASWRWIFLINVPIGIATFALGVGLIKENDGLGLGRGVDVTGSVLITAALLIGIYGIVTAATHGWASAHTFGYGAVGVVLLVAFFVVQAKRANPIMPLRILRIRSLIGSSVVRGCLFIGMQVLFFLGALYLQDVRGYSPLRTGLAFLPTTVVVAAMSMWAVSRLLIRFGPIPVVLPGLVLALAGLLLLTRTDQHSAYATGVLPPLLILAVGISCSTVPLLSLAMTEVPAEDAGLASGIVNVSMWLASAVGLAVVSSVAASRTKSLVRHGHSEAAALVSGYHVGYLIGAGCVVVALLIVLTVLLGPARAASAARRRAAEPVTPAAPRAAVGSEP